MLYTYVNLVFNVLSIDENIVFVGLFAIALLYFCCVWSSNSMNKYLLVEISEVFFLLLDLLHHLAHERQGWNVFLWTSSLHLSSSECTRNLSDSFQQWINSLILLEVVSTLKTMAYMPMTPGMSLGPMHELLSSLPNELHLQKCPILYEFILMFVESLQTSQ